MVARWERPKTMRRWPKATRETRRSGDIAIRQHWRFRSSGNDKREKVDLKNSIRAIFLPQPIQLQNAMICKKEKNWYDFSIPSTDYCFLQLHWINVNAGLTRFEAAKSALNPWAQKQGKCRVSSLICHPLPSPGIHAQIEHNFKHHQLRYIVRGTRVCFQPAHLHLLLDCALVCENDTDVAQTIEEMNMFNTLVIHHFRIKMQRKIDVL